MLVQTGCCDDCGYGDTSDTGDTDVNNQDSGEDSDSDTSADTDTNVDTDTDTGPDVTGDCHPASPVATGGWSRTYSVSYQGASGTETQTGLGNGQVRSEMSAGANGWNIVQTFRCTSGKLESVGWEGDVSQSIDLMGTAMPISACVKSTTNPPRPDLSDMATLKAKGSWSYSYTMDIAKCDPNDSDNPAEPGAVPTSGTYTAWGPGTNPNPATSSYQAFKVTNTFDQKGSSYPLGGLKDLDGYAEQYYVKGLGLVKEVMSDVNDPSQVYLSKELTGYTGLTPAQP
jgi:hypothetical protein